MSRRVAAAALGLLVWAAPALGDERAERDLSGDPGFSEISPAELRALEAYAALRGGHPIRARELAQELLRDDPESVEGHVLLGSVLYEAEGDLARAHHMLLRGKQLFEQKHGRLSGSSEVEIWHAEALRLLDQVASEMGREREALGYQREWQALYGGSRPGWSAWLLMRLGRLDEARRVAELSLEDANGVDSRDSARAALCAIDAEALDRDATYQSCVEGARQSKAEGGEGAVPWSNAAEAAGMALRLGEVERLLLEATRHDADDFVNPWADLAILYTGQGRLSEGQSALREMVSWREAQAANVRAQTWAHSDLAAAEFLLAAGRSEDAARITERALAAPDRHGSSNEDPGQRSAAAALLDAAVERTRAQEAWEATSWLPFWRALPAWFAGWWHTARAWLSERRALDGLSNPRFLSSTLRPYLADQITLPEWLQPELTRVLGPGLTAAALAEARAAETHPIPSAGYFAAFDCEIARLRGDWAAVGQAARRALISLPQSEVLLRSRVAALHGDAARREGDAARSVAAYDLALQRDPGVVRRLGLTLPVHFEVSGGALAEEAAALLRRSPRLGEAEGGFRLQVSAAGESGRACLVGAFGEVIGCGRVEPRAGEDVRTRARRLAEDFHAGVFSARLSLSQADLRSLDGSPLAAGRSSVELAVPELFQPGDAP